MDETPPDGSAATLAQTAATLQPLTTPLVVFLLLVIGSFPGAIFLLTLLTWATYRCTADALPSSRSLLRGTLMVALASLPMAAVLPEALPQVLAGWVTSSVVLNLLAGVWALLWLLVWRFIRRRVSDRQLRRNLDNGFLPTALVLLLAVVLPWLAPSPDAVVGLLVAAGVVCMLLVGRAVRATRALWPLTNTQPTDFLEAIQERFEADFGLTASEDRLDGIVSGIHVSVHVNTSTLPAVTVIQTSLGATSPSLRVRARRGEEPGGRPLSDPLLGRLLFIEGLTDAAMLDGLHEDLLGVLHGWPDSVLEGGQLTVRIPGPPFDAARIGEAPVPDEANALAEFLARRVGEAVALATALHGRSCARDVARRYQGLKTPEGR